MNNMCEVDHYNSPYAAEPDYGAMAQDTIRRFGRSVPGSGYWYDFMAEIGADDNGSKALASAWVALAAGNDEYALRQFRSALESAADEWVKPR